MTRRVVLDGREAPTCNVRYRCLKCRMEIVADAYDGPPSCLRGHPAIFMDPLNLMHPHPDALDERGQKPQ